MNSFDHRKYTPFAPIPMAKRRWPDQQIKQAPRWCSVDLRDGNQALIEPMNPKQKLALFKLLVDVGFKEIEVGFPAASQTDFDFVRQIIEQGLIPEDVTIQVLTQSREALIKRSFEALKGCRQAIMHLYNSTSTVQREQVFAKSKNEIKAIAVQGAQWVKQQAAQQPDTQWTFQYSPESFTGTELDYAVEVCDAVNAVWQPTKENPVIINLPATVEVATPNIYADQIEWMGDHIQHREAVVISLHTHNDRGCGVAAAELGVMAGADRVEGTLLGNGERTGNMDIVTMAMNLYSQGINPELDLSNMDKIIQTVTECTQLPLHPRHPYAGELVFTAFSGSHQDAIKKCLQRYQPGDHWDVAYLPIDPADLGRNYQEVIRINSQSGKGGIAYILEQDYGLQMPRWLQVDFSQYVQQYAEEESAEVSPASIYKIFEQSYIARKQPIELEAYQISRQQEQDQLSATITIDGQSTLINSSGQGVMEAFIGALNKQLGYNMVLVDYSEHTLGDNERSEAISYIQLNIENQRYCGVGKSKDIIEASLEAVLSAVNCAIPALKADVIPA
ncbi:2-isopropylmalate synthase [Oceanicoccus sagamiensis]|uniref:2-isopropylmalate synthase n=1 Tax=Oceanicoccus sagamiensis TaxID=716816 RepID=A0A1X9ND68_9GAMM|nr:2-isopropylmalate synthase [Oceanicoccus sagamiensis]ARN75980.1 2-isopropylmalate synthase [Oceanicoccus sagamiensis]